MITDLFHSIVNVQHTFAPVSPNSIFLIQLSEPRFYLVHDSSREPGYDYQYRI